MRSPATSGINGPFEPVSPTDGQVVYVLLNRLPLNRIAPAPLDLHTLGTPLAFVLSQDQTLHVMVEPVQQSAWSQAYAQPLLPAAGKG